MNIYKKLALFAGGTLFGSAGIKLLSSKDAKNAYAHTAAAALRMKDCVMTTVNTVQENAADVLATAKDINEQRAQQAEQAQQEDQAQTTDPAQAAAGQTTGNAAAQPAQMTPAADTTAPETAAEGEAQPAVQDEQQPAADTEQNPDAIAPEN